MKIVVTSLAFILFFGLSNWSESYGQVLRLPADSEFSAPSITDKNQIAEWLLEFDTFYTRHTSVALGMVGETIRATRGSDQVEITSFRGVSAKGIDRKEREVFVAINASPDQSPRLAIDPGGELIDVSEFPKMDEDYCFDGIQAAIRSPDRNSFVQVKTAYDRKSMCYYGWTEPMISWVKSLPQANPILKTASDFLPLKDLEGIRETDGMTFARWVMMVGQDARIFYRVTIAFQNGRPVFVADDQCGRKGQKPDGEVYQMFTLGTVIIDWEAIGKKSDEEYAPSRIRHRSIPAPQFKKSEYQEVESDTRFKWTLDEAVNQEIFQHSNIGKIDMTIYLPQED